MGCVRFMSESFIAPSVVADTIETSEASGFPVTNTVDGRRSKVWRSNSYWKIVSGDNTIVFRDDTVTDKTATIAAGEYTSVTAFMAAVDAAFEAAGSANYTVTQNSNLKFVIASDLSGGASAFQLRWTHANSADMAAIMGFDTASNDTGASTYTADFLRINTEERIIWDLGIPSNPTSFLLIGRRNESLPLSPNGTINLQANETFNFENPTTDIELTYDDEILSELSEDGLADGPKRFWSIQFLDQNPRGYIEVGELYLGGHYSPDVGKPQFPFVSNFVDRTETVFSEGGQSFSEIRETSQEFQVDWFPLAKDEIEDLKDLFDQFGTGKSLFISFDSDAVFSTAEQRMIRFVKFASPPNYQLTDPNIFRMTMRFREEL